ncbi:pseudouridine synthase [Sansalvadorimonas sp. 2012CJ34-2]|uniref:Dual-specificity RNA pseudouridine synthase RluA n=1 Tax=Parendozoicomonas callyspongiae TaxID=2942213 RepID=A0ABT0PBN6_9GAMM|nr:pseudouridine synthase [Sansalvadorimonas sp. 2012CJ34-2]MCL6268636.1 pseudouridine synthase [Sansalvadorimonas sp. 2012CJ34-2]
METTITASSPATPAQDVFIVPPCREQVDFIYVDEHCLLINKPSGLLSVPGRHPANQDCAISRVQLRYPDALIVHRLDMDTSGLMVIARGAESHRNLSQQFENRSVEKEYQAWVHGILKPGEGIIELPLRCDWPNRPKQMVDFEQGKPAITRYQVSVRDSGQNKTRVKLFPVTGRSHQLRVHTAELGHPILGCNFYAHEDARTAARRLQLHACYLKLRHPKTGEELIGRSTPPF